MCNEQRLLQGSFFRSVFSALLIPFQKGEYDKAEHSDKDDDISKGTHKSLHKRVSMNLSQDMLFA